MGQKNDIHDCKTLLDKVAGAGANFENYAKELGIDGKLIDSIKADFVKV